MKWRSESVPAWQKRVQKWHRWFAWHPVRVGDHTVAWFEFVERRAVFDSVLEWHYRVIE